MAQRDPHAKAQRRKVVELILVSFAPSRDVASRLGVRGLRAADC
jgi:hypothetical protein